MASLPRPHLVVMARLPAVGGAKTRLSRTVGAVEATRCYRVILGDTLRRLAPDPRWRTWLAVAPDGAAHTRIWPPSTRVVGQGGGDLGARMQRLFEEMPPGPVVIVGSDIPGIARSDVAASFHLLGQADAVFGPAADGGYWLVGLRRIPRVVDPFAGVRWSTPHALADTLANLDGKRIGLLRTLDDVDEADAYRSWRRRPYRWSW